MLVLLTSSSGSDHLAGFVVPDLDRGACRVCSVELLGEVRDHGRVSGP